MMKKGYLQSAVLVTLLCGFGTFGAFTVSADVYDVQSGNSETLTATRDTSNVVTVKVVTGDIAEKSNALVTGKTVYEAIHGGKLDLGSSNTVNTANGSAFGASNTVSGTGSAAVGFTNTASKDYSYALGFSNQANGEGTSALGYVNKATGDYASAVGVMNNAAGIASSALGYANTASGQCSSALGSFSNATVDGATAVGYQAVSTEAGTVSFGHKSGDPMGYRAGNYSSDSFARLTNIAEGYNDNDAVNFSQIKTEAGKIIKASTTLIGATPTLNADGTVGKNLKALDDAIVANDTYKLNDDKKTITVKNNAGTTAFTLNLDGISGGAGATYTAGDNVEISEDNVISVKADGKVEAGNEGIVTGGEVYNGINGIRSDLEGQINKVGAGAAALAMLHSEGFDPANKWNFAVGYGHYKNANAGALGAFYKPNADTTVTVASTMGNGNPMVGAGVSFKIGHRGENFAPNASNEELANEVNRLRKVNADQTERIASLEAQVVQILKKLELSDTVKKTAATL